MSLQAPLALLTALLFGMALLTVLAKQLAVPYPALLLLGGILLAMTPGVPAVELPPEVVLQVFLPPLLLGAGWRTSWNDMRSGAGGLLHLSVGLVAATTLAVGVATHWALPQLPWSACWILGAIVSPTDALAANAIAGRLHLPHRLVNLLEAESVANDATGLVAYRFLVAAAAGASLGPATALGAMLWASFGGAALGLAVGAAAGWLLDRFDDPPVEIALQLVTGYAAYLPAEQLGVSGVFAAASAGLYLGWISPQVFTSQTRLDAAAFWNTLDYLLNGLLFLLLGMQVHLILADPLRLPWPKLLKATGATIAAALLTRWVWVIGARFIEGRFRKPSLSWKATAVLGWTGLRGVLSLATALALPFGIDGNPFVGRRTIIFLGFAVVVFTLGLQGITLPAVLGWLSLDGSDDAPDEAPGSGEAAARASALRAAQEHLASRWATLTTAELGAARELQGRLADQLSSGDLPKDRQASFPALRRELMDVERQTLLALRRAGQLDDHALRRIERDLDLEEVGL